MGAMASQITSLTIVYSIVYSDADQRKHQSSADRNLTKVGSRVIMWKIYRSNAKNIRMYRFTDMYHSRRNEPIWYVVFYIARHCLKLTHYNDIKMSAMVSQITSPTIVCSSVYWRGKSKKISKFRVTGLCAWNSPVTGEVPTQRASDAEMFPFDDVIMLCQNPRLLGNTQTDSHTFMGHQRNICSRFRDKQR